MKKTISIDGFLRKTKIRKYSGPLKMIWEKKGYDVVALDISGQFSYSDFIVICSAGSTKHAQTIADAVLEEMKKGKGRLGLEGYNPGDWILVDIGGAVIHIFTEETRSVYDLEGLWHDAPAYVIDEKAVK